MERIFQIAERGMELFFRSLPMALGLAMLCTLVQMAVPFVARATFLAAPLFLYAHAWFVLVVTGWHLRSLTPEFSVVANATRAALLALPVTLAFAAILLLLAAATAAFQSGRDPVYGDVLIAGDALFYSWQADSFVVLGRQLNGAIWMIVWTIAILMGLPARMMAGRGTSVRMPIALLAGLAAAMPWLIVTAILGYPSQVCTGECWGFMEGGIFMIPLLAAYLFTLSASCAAVSAAVRLETAGS